VDQLDVSFIMQMYSGRRHGQIYSYPAQRWKKKSSLPLPDVPLPHAKSAEAEIPESGAFMFVTCKLHHKYDCGTEWDQDESCP